MKAWPLGSALLWCLLAGLGLAEDPASTSNPLPEVASCTDKDKSAKAFEPTAEDKELVARVAVRVLGEVSDDERALIADYEWPPEICIHPTKDVNAFASLRIETVSGKEVKIPHIQINQGYLDKIVQGKEEFFAKVFGHELSHILLRHVDPSQPSAGPLVWNIVSREHETNADILGMKLALRANYPYRTLIASMAREREDGNLCAFQALASTHPAWADRLAAIDDRQSELWRATGTFENGVNFLGIEQYAMAARCFQQVVKDFPRCHEAWTDLGYAKLMLYCDSLDLDEVRQLGIGQLAVGGFYKRAASIEPSRGIPEEDWEEAVAAFHEALQIKPKSIVALALSATAMLVQPTDRDLSKANEAFAQAIAAMDERDVVEPVPVPIQATILANAGAGQCAAGDYGAAEKLFNRLEKLLGKNFEPGGAMQVACYHRAQALGERDDAESHAAALQLWQQYLESTSKTGVWWEIAYDNYQKLCSTTQAKPRTREELDLRRKVKSRPVLSVAVGEGKSVTVGVPLGEAVESLGEGEKTDLIRGTNIQQRRYRNLGVDLIGSDLLLLVRLRSKKSPELALTPLGGGPSTKKLRVGMTLAEFEQSVAGSGAEYDTRYSTGSSMPYRFYPQLGIGISLDEKKVVDEIVVGQLPYPAEN